MPRKPTKDEFAKAMMEGKITNKDTLATFIMIKELEHKIDDELPNINNLISRVRGKDGHTPTNAELIEIIRPLIPIAKDGRTPTDAELLKLIKPLIPKVNDGKTPTKNEILEIIKQLIPNIEDIVQIAKSDVMAEIIPQIPTIEKIEQDIPKLGNAIRDSLELLQGDERLSKTAIKGLEKVVTDETLNRAIGILDQRSQFLINKPEKDPIWLAEKTNYYNKTEVDSLISTENLFDRTGTVLSPHNAGDSLDMGAGNILTAGTVDGVDVSAIPTTYLRLDQTVAQTTVGTFTFPILHTPTINGGILANDDITIQGTTHDTRTTSYVILQPNGGNVGIGTTSPNTKLHIKNTTDIGLNIEAGNTYDPYIIFTSDVATYIGYDQSLAILKINGQPGLTAYNNLVVSTAGNVGIGVDAPQANLDIGVGVANINYSGSKLLVDTGITFARANSGAAAGPYFITRRARGTYATPTIVSSDDLAFSFIGQAYDGAGFKELGRFEFVVDGTPGADDMPGRIDFYTTPDGSATKQPRMVIKNTGNVGIGTTGPTNILSLGGNSARIFWLERHTTANTAGNTLTITAGGATSGATDKAGGNLLLQGGLSTGSAESGVSIYGCVAGASGTTDRTQTVAIQTLGNKIGFFAGTPIVRQSFIAYTADNESVAYTGIDNAQAETPYAQLTDINALRVAYENLRVAYEDLKTKMVATTLITTA